MVIPVKPLIRRHKSWSNIVKKHLAMQPLCQCCGRNDALDVHHIIPVSIDRSKETDPTNLITLCRPAKRNKTYCHFTQGHLGIDWKHYDYNIIKRAELFRDALEKI